MLLLPIKIRTFSEVVIFTNNKITFYARNKIDIAKNFLIELATIIDESIHDIEADNDFRKFNASFRLKRRNIVEEVRNQNLSNSDFE